MKSSVNGYHESLIEALRNAAATTSSQRGSNSSNSFGLGAGGGANTGGAGSNHRSSAASLTVNFDYKGMPFAQIVKILKSEGKQAWDLRSTLSKLISKPGIYIKLCLDLPINPSYGLILY